MYTYIHHILHVTEASVQSLQLISQESMYILPRRRLEAQGIGPCWKVSDLSNSPSLTNGRGPEPVFRRVRVLKIASFEGPMILRDEKMFAKRFPFWGSMILKNVCQTIACFLCGKIMMSGVFFGFVVQFLVVSNTPDMI